MRMAETWTSAFMPILLTTHPGLADGADETLCAARTGDGAQPDLGQSKEGVFPCKEDVAHERELAAPS